MTWCNMSHNQINNLGGNPFARNSVMGWLSLSHNLITKLETRMMRSMRFLRRLFLSDNLIKKVCMDWVPKMCFNVVYIKPFHNCLVLFICFGT